jgi:hypothetical protein
VAQAEGVRRQRGFDGRPDVGAKGRRRRHNLLQPLSQQRFAAGEPHLAHTEPLDGDAHEPHHLGVGQNALAGSGLHPFGGHAVRTAKIAFVGERDPQIARDASETIDELRHARAVRWGRTARPQSGQAEMHHRIRPYGRRDRRGVHVFLYAFVRQT